MKNLTSVELVSKTKSLCAEERRITTEVLLHLREIEARRIYAELGYSSLFEFAVKELKYSEGAAGRRIAAMRMMREVPELEEKIREGTLNVTTIAMAKRMTEGKTIEEKEKVLEKLTHQSQREAEKTLASLYPEKVLKEKERVLDEKMIEIRFTADAELMKKFERIRNHFSHKNPNATYQELFHLMADALLKKQTKTVTPPVEKPRVTRYVAKWIREDLYKDYRCSYPRCTSTHLLQVDHIIPYALGGLTTRQNLRLLCRAHNLYEARRRGLLRETSQ